MAHCIQNIKKKTKVHVFQIVAIFLTSPTRNIFNPNCFRAKFFDYELAIYLFLMTDLPQKKLINIFLLHFVTFYLVNLF